MTGKIATPVCALARNDTEKARKDTEKARKDTKKKFFKKFLKNFSKI